jgi:hypothetical protein
MHFAAVFVLESWSAHPHIVVRTISYLDLLHFADRVGIGRVDRSDPERVAPNSPAPRV